MEFGMPLIECLRIISSKTTMPQRQSSKNNLKEIKKLDIILNKLLIKIFDNFYYLMWLRRSGKKLVIKIFVESNKIL